MVSVIRPFAKRKYEKIPVDRIKVLNSRNRALPLGDIEITLLGREELDPFSMNSSLASIKSFLSKALR